MTFELHDSFLLFQMTINWSKFCYFWILAKFFCSTWNHCNNIIFNYPGQNTKNFWLILFSPSSILFRIQRISRISRTAEKVWNHNLSVFIAIWRLLDSTNKFTFHAISILKSQLARLWIATPFRRFLKAFKAAWCRTHTRARALTPTPRVCIYLSLVSIWLTKKKGKNERFTLGLLIHRSETLNLFLYNY